MMVCVCVCACVYVCVCRRDLTPEGTNSVCCLSPRPHTRTHTLILTHTHTHAHTCTRTHAHARTNAHTNAHTRTHACAHTRTHKHTRTHTHSQNRKGKCFRAPTGQNFAAGVFRRRLHGLGNKGESNAVHLKEHPRSKSSVLDRQFCFATQRSLGFSAQASGSTPGPKTPRPTPGPQTPGPT